MNFGFIRGPVLYGFFSYSPASAVMRWPSMQRKLMASKVQSGVWPPQKG